MPAHRRSRFRTWSRRAGAALAVLGAALCVLLPAATTRAATPPTIPPIDPIEAPDPSEQVIVDLDDVGLPLDESGTDAGTTGGDDDGEDGDEDGDTATIGIEVPDAENASNVVVIILLLTVLSVAPSILVMMTSFTRIVIVMSLTRNALGIPQLPPQQVIVGLSMFLPLFVMGPTLSELNDVALQPLLDGKSSITEAAEAAEDPMREFLLDYTREPELELFLDATETETPVAREEVPMTALIPAFVLSELKSAFILGFIIFVPFLVIDLVVSAVLTSLGMMMMPPTFVSLPLKLLLFVLLDGWSLVVGTLLRSYQ